MRRWRSERDQGAVDEALAQLAAVAAADAGGVPENMMLATIAAARAGATTGEWAGTLREVFGEYRAQTGVGAARRRSPTQTSASCARGSRGCRSTRPQAQDRRRQARARRSLKRRRADRRAARDAGIDVVYAGIRLTPAPIAASAVQEDVHVVGLSILSGSHRELIPAVMDALAAAGVSAPVVVGGIIPEQDVADLRRAGVAAVYTPKDFDITRIMRDIVELLGAGEPAPVAGSGAAVNGSA